MNKRNLDKGRAAPKARALSVILSIQLVLSMLPVEAIAEVEAHASISSQSSTGIEAVEEPSSNEAAAAPPEDPATSTSEPSFTGELSPSELVGRLDPMSNDELVVERKDVNDGMGAIITNSEQAAYVFENAEIRVVARLPDRSAIPEDAKLLVTAIQKDTEGYDHDAYLRALNASSDKEHSEGNVLLYDVTFVVRDTKIMPDEDLVSIDFDFKKDQLADVIGAQYPEDIKVCGLSAKDGTVSVEPLKAEVSVSDEQARFEAKGFSVYAFSRPTVSEGDEHIYTTQEEDGVQPSTLTTISEITDPVSDEESVDVERPSLIATLKNLNHSDWVLKILNNYRKKLDLMSSESSIFTLEPTAIVNKNDQKTESLAESLKGITISEQPVSATVAAGQTASFSVAVSGSGLAYRWQQRDPGASSWRRSSLPGNRTRTLSFTAEEAQSGTKFRCVVTNKYDQKVVSSAATLRVTPKPASSEEPPASDQPTTGGDQPGDQPTTGGDQPGDQPTTGDQPGDQPTTGDQPGGQTTGGDQQGEQPTTGDQPTTGGQPGDQPGGQTTGGDQPGDQPTTGDQPSSSDQPSTSDTLTISEQPVSATVAAGQTASFSVAVSGSGLAYRWQQRDPGTSSWTRSALAGNRTRTLSFTAEEAQSGTKFRCVVNDKYGQKVVSSAATLRVTPATHTTYRALLVGNANYRGISNDLPECSTDAKAMATMLRGLSSEYTTTVRLNRSASQISSDISSTFSEADDDDVSLFYYSGHGAYSARPEYLGALCGVNDTYLTTSKLAQTLSGVRGKVIVILDSCYSGAAIAAQDDQSGSYAPDIDMSAINQHIIDSFAAYDSGLYINTQSDSTSSSGGLRQSKFVVLTACSDSETSSVGTLNGTRGSLTTIALLEGAGCSYPSGAYKGSMPADKNKNKQISLGEAEAYELKRITSYSCQTYGSKDEVLFDRK